MIYQLLVVYQLVSVFLQLFDSLLTLVSLNLGTDGVDVVDRVDNLSNLFARLVLLVNLILKVKLKCLILLSDLFNLFLEILHLSRLIVKLTCHQSKLLLLLLFDLLHSAVDRLFPVI